MGCVSKRRGCESEFPCSVDQMKQAFRRAEKYEPDKSPYGFPAYPYVWRAFPDTMTIQMEMGYRGENRLVAQFKFEFQAGRQGACVHVAVWVVRPTEDPSVEGFAAIPSKDTRLHAAAVPYFRGLLMGLPVRYTIVPPPEEEVPPPPPIDL